MNVRPALLLAALAAAPTAANAEPPSADVAPSQRRAADLDLDLVVGETRTLSADGVRNFSEGVAGIVDVKLTTDQRKFVVVGKRAGTTSLLLIYGDGSQNMWLFHVFRYPPEAVHRELGQLLGPSPGLSVRRVGTRLFLEGTVASAEEVERIERVAALYPGQVESLVTEAPPPEASQVNLRIDFFFVQYDKLSGHGFGVDWPARIGGETVHNELTYDFVRGTTTTATASISDQPLPALDLAAHQGWAKVLDQSTVITQNGSEATFESGGEQNYPVSAAQTASIQSIEHGVKVTVLPRLDSRSGLLHLGMTADVAHLVPGAYGSPLPGRATSRLQTAVRMRLGQSLILSGIRVRELRKSGSGLPLLSEIPVLGVLFGSQRAESRDVESAVFVIPSAVESVSQPAMRLVEQALQQFEGFEGDVDSVEVLPQTPGAWLRSP